MSRIKRTKRRIDGLNIFREKGERAKYKTSIFPQQVLAALVVSNQCLGMSRFMQKKNFNIECANDSNFLSKSLFIFMLFN